MRKIILDKQQIHDLVWHNRYKVEEKTKFFSRCVDGRYNKNIKYQISNIKNGVEDLDLPPLAIPGADAGELAILFAAANEYGFEINKEKTLKTLLEILGGIKNFNFHSDHHGNPKIPASGCGHIKQMVLDPKAYNIKQEQLAFIQKKLEKIRKQGAQEIILEGEHLEGAVLQIKGPYSLYPRFFLDSENGQTEIEVFCFYSSLVDGRHKLLAKKLVENKAVKLFEGCGEEYLYEILSETTENHLFETLKRLAFGLPIYSVEFAEGGSFNVEEMGSIS